MTADENWKPAWIEDNSPLVRKILKVDWFTSYLDVSHQRSAFASLGRAEFSEALQQTLPTDDQPAPKHDYVIHPVRSNLLKKEQSSRLSPPPRPARPRFR